MFLKSGCSICGSPYLTDIRTVRTHRTNRDIPLYFCLNCHSCLCPSGYTETESQWKDDAQYHIRTHDTKKNYFKKFASSLPKHRTYADIGCGLGTLANEMAACGLKVTGYDLNPFVIEAGRARFPGLDLQAVLFGSDGKSYDTALLIDVAEHLTDPLSFFRFVLTRAKILYVSVPRFDPHLWPYLLTDDISVKSPFHDTDVHVTHFSTLGLHALAPLIGAKIMRDDVSQPWPNNGIWYQKL